MKKKLNAGGYERIRIGSHIRKWRSIKDMKQKDLAAALKMSEATLSNIENDFTDISLSHLEDIAIVLDIPVENLFTDPQDNIAVNNRAYKTGDGPVRQFMDKDLIYALIGSIQKKDEQLTFVLDNVMDKLPPGKSLMTAATQ